MTKGFSGIFVLIGVLVIVTVAGGVYYFGSQKSPAPTQTQACTEEGRYCPDGSSVVRTGPNCEFAVCPSDETKDWKTYTSTKYSYQIKHPNLAEDTCNVGALSSVDVIDKLLVRGSSKAGTEVCGDYNITIAIDGEGKTGFSKVNDYISYREKSYGEKSDNFTTSTVNLSGLSIADEKGIEAEKLTILNYPNSPIYFFSDPSGKQLYYIMVTASSQLYGGEIDQILSTFKFTQ